MKYPLLVPVIGHGATDIVDFPIKSVIYNIFSLLFVKNMSYNNRKIILVLFSIYHLTIDINCKYKYIIISLFHILMIKKPLIAKCYFCFYHTPMHYLRQIFINTKWSYKMLLGTVTSLLANYGINNNIETFMDKKLGEFWWISPILVHIILTNNQQIKFINNYKNNKFYYYIKRIIIL